MKIGIDAKWFFEGPPSGVNVVKNIVIALIEENIENELYIFLNSKSKKLDFLWAKNQKNVFLIYIPSYLNIITNLFFFPLYSAKYKLDIILFQNYIPLYRFGNTKYINYVHDYLFLDYKSYFSRVERFLYKFIVLSVNNADHVITISKTEQKRIIKYSGLNEDKVSFIYHGIDKLFSSIETPSRLSIAKKYNIPETYILYVGRLNVRKNIITLINCMPRLVKEFNISLVIVGKEDNINFNLREIIKNLGLENNIFIIGHVPEKKLADIYSAAKIFVFPSFAEGFGLPPLEAMKSGVPTLVSRIQPFIELFGNSVLYFNPKSIPECEKKIRYFLTDVDLCREYIDRGIVRASIYSWKNSANEILKLFNKFNNK